MKIESTGEVVCPCCLKRSVDINIRGFLNKEFIHRCEYCKRGYRMTLRFTATTETIEELKD